MLSRPVLLGHRGVRGGKSTPENTVAAFDRALEAGCDGFEFDVRLTGNGRMVVCHDARVDGITISDTSPEQVLQLPELGDVLRRYSSRGFLNIELKVEGIETKVLAALREWPPERGCVVSSFLPDVVLELKARSAIVAVGIICEKPSQLAVWSTLPVDYVMAQQSLVTRELIDLIHGAGRNIFVWTVNDAPSMIRLAGWGVDGIIADDPLLLARTLAH
jgi:glycerophosphoryl diester phosphodiesterase